MVTRRFVLGDDNDVVLPRGTRVVLKTAVTDDDGRTHRPGVHVVVREVRGRVYRVQTVAGAWMTAPRDQLQPEAPDALAALGARQHDFARLRQGVVLATVVGSRAWGLANDDSDEDVRGCFVLPFEDHASIFQAPDEIHDDTAAPDDPQEAFWEIAALVRQGLRADPNTLETLWSPLVKEKTAIGDRLVNERAIFSSMHVLGSFGRYATSQLKKLEHAQQRRAALMSLLHEMLAGRVSDEASARVHLGALDGHEALHALVRSLADRGVIAASSFAALQTALDELGPAPLVPEEVRPKNAYNLVRLLHSCLHWLQEGTPLIVVEGPLKAMLLDIKHGRLTLDQTMALARTAAAAVDEAARLPARLPESPDFAAADALVIAARRQAARLSLGMSSSSSSSSSTPTLTALAVPMPETPVPVPAWKSTWTSTALVPTLLPTALPDDVDTAALRRFVEAQARTLPGPWLWMGLTGAHAYGFPSPDSDLDLKAVHTVAADTLLRTRGNAEPPPIEVVVDDWEGREMDLSSHELGQCTELLLKGNGNMLERLLGPFAVVTTPLGAALSTWAASNLSKRSVHHYRGFLGAMVREHAVDLRDRGGPRAKRLLYMYRAALTGVHLLQAGVLVTDIRTLAPIYGFDAVVGDLLIIKQTAELQTVPASMVQRVVDTDVPKLFALLDEAASSSSLPPEPQDIATLDAILVDARMQVLLDRQ